MNRINWDIIDNKIDYLNFNEQILNGKVVDVYDGEPNEISSSIYYKKRRK